MSRNVLVTNAAGFAGPAAVRAFIENGDAVWALDADFSHEHNRKAFEAAHPGVVTCDYMLLESGATEVTAELGWLDTVVSNDHYPADHAGLTGSSTDSLRQTLEALVVQPFARLQVLLPLLRNSASPNVVIVNSNRSKLPVRGGCIPDAARDAMNALMTSWAKELAPEGIVVNAVAPNYFYSEAYYPRARFVDDPQGRRFVADTVPAGRLGNDTEMGELILFLGTLSSRFTTGAVVDFAGGWPLAMTPETWVLD